MRGEEPTRYGSFAGSRAALAMALASLMVWASVAGLVLHDHGGAAELAGYHCSASHDPGSTASPAGSDEELRRSGQRHHHQCPGCKLSAQRSQMVTGRGAPANVALPPAPGARPLRLLRTFPPRTAETRRGPPPA